MSLRDRARVPGPRGLPLLGSLLEFRRDMTGFTTRLARRYGDVALFRLGPQKVFLVSDPEEIGRVLVTGHRNFVKSRGLERMKPLLGEGLLTSEGEFHLRQRRHVQPAFHHERLEGYAEAMVRQVERRQNRWSDGATPDVAEEMRAVTLAIAGETLFSADLTDETAEITDALTAILDLFPRILLPFAELLERLPLPGTRRFERERRRLDAIVYRMIERRRAGAKDRGDVLSMLLTAADEGVSMSDTQIRDEVITLLLAGHETTANALTWAWYLLSENPEVEAALHRELDAVLGDRPPTFEDLAELKVTRAVLAESMRLFPPAWLIGRRALDDWEADGWPVPAGSLIFMSPWVVHRDPRHWPDPLRFDPARWTSEHGARRHRFTYFPFGAGPRLCIGEGFAWMEGTLLIAALARRWRLRLVPGHPVEVLPRVTLRPRHGMRMRLDRRRET